MSGTRQVNTFFPVYFCRTLTRFDPLVRREFTPGPWFRRRNSRRSSTPTGQGAAGSRFSVQYSAAAAWMRHAFHRWRIVVEISCTLSRR